MSDRSELDRFVLYYEAPPRSAGLMKLLAEINRSIQAGRAKVFPLMPVFGRGKKR